MNWTFDTVALAAAKAKLNLERPVRFEATRALASVTADAEHDGSEINKHHIIRVKPDFSLEKTNRSLWHEFAHARQLQRDFEFDNEAMSQLWISDLIEFGCLNPTPINDPDGDRYMYSSMYMTNFNEWLRRYFRTPLEREAQKLSASMYWRYNLVMDKPSDIDVVTISGFKESLEEGLDN